MKTRRMDYHLHTTFSPDATQSVDALAQTAVSMGLDEICITDHLDKGHPTPEFAHSPNYSQWLSAIAAAQDKYPELLINKGIEIGDNALLRDHIEDELSAVPLDFRLLSLHILNGQDPYDPRFFDQKTQEQAYRLYAEKRLESILHFKDYDAVAHLGYVCKFAPYPPDTRPMRLHHAKEPLDALLKHMAKEGKALEINASGFLHTQSPLPGFDLIRHFISVGGTFFTFGSDAHSENRVYAHVQDAKQIARDAGARWQVGFQNRVMRVFKL